MGADIHMFIEKRVNNKWELVFTDNMWGTRNYSMFSTMASVRGNSPYSRFPKGIPQDSSQNIFKKYTLKIISDEDFTTWVESGRNYASINLNEDENCGVTTLSKALQNNYDIYYDKDGNPDRSSQYDYHDATWFTLSEYKQVLSDYFKYVIHDASNTPHDIYTGLHGAYISILNKMEEFGTDSRLIVWFDS